MQREFDAAKDFSKVDGRHEDKRNGLSDSLAQDNLKPSPYGRLYSL
jgi:hypothetical protein